VIEAKTSNLVDVLMQRAADGGRAGYIFLSDDGEHEAESLTYEWLYRDACVLGRRLNEYGNVGDRALLVFPSGIEYIKALFGCLCASRIPVPVYPPNLRKESEKHFRFGKIVHDCAPKLALTITSLVPRVERLLEDEGVSGQVDVVPTDLLEHADRSEWVPPKISNETVALIQYTSGSTASPKGVVLSHSNLVHNQEMIKKACNHNMESTFVGWLPLYHDMGLIGNVLQPLYIGASSILMSPSCFLQDPIRWLRAITRYRGRTSGGPNFAFDLCVTRIRPEERESLDLSTWTVAFNGAESVRYSTLEKFAREFRNCGFSPTAFYPCYGLAEATLMVSGGPRSNGVRVARARSGKYSLKGEQKDGEKENPAGVVASSGKTVSGTEIAIVDERSSLRCEEGHIGEIWVSGPAVGQGYWNHPESTRAVFKRTLEDETKHYLRTGDLGFMLDGHLFVTGRIKDLVIVRGRNYHPEDIEFSIKACRPELSTASVAAFGIEVSGHEEVAVVVEIGRYLLPEREPICQTIRSAVGAEHGLRVHSVMLVRQGIVPRTSSGKIQRHMCKQKFISKSLRPLYFSTLPNASRMNSLTAEETTLASELAVDSENHLDLIRKELSSVLGIGFDRVSMNVPLTALGMDSVGAAQLASTIARKWGVEIDPIDLLDRSTVGDVLERVTLQTAGNSASQSEGPIEMDLDVDGDKSVETIVTLEQKRLWLVDRLSSVKATLNLTTLVSVMGPLDYALLENVLVDLLKRHESLRSCFKMDRGEIRRIVLEEPKTNLSVEDISQMNSTEVDEYVTKKCGEEGDRPFDVSAGGLIRFRLLKTARDRHSLIVTVHHITADAQSVVILVRELERKYSGCIDIVKRPRPLTAIERRTFIGARGVELGGKESGTGLSYWKCLLTPASPKLFQMNVDENSALAKGAEREFFEVSDGLLREMKRFACEERVTPFMVLAATVNALLWSITAVEDIAIGIPVSGRTLSQFEELVGCFAYPIILRTNLSGNPTFQDIVSRTRERCLAAYKHQGVPFSEIVRVASPCRNGLATPLIQAMCSYLRADRMKLLDGRTEFVFEGPQRTPTDIPLFFSFVETEERIKGLVMRNGFLIGRRSLEGLGKRFVSTLQTGIGITDYRTA
jgi:acyl-CoA synthetase (AMP-forming)/AMP-acid ligase II/acyl carrier protein